MKKKLLIISLAFGVLLLLNGCKAKSTELKALENTASVIQLQTGREVSRSLQDKGNVLGKLIYAEVNLEYEPVNDHTKREVFDEIIAILQKTNWKREDMNVVPDYFKASLKQGDSTFLVNVLIISDKNLVSVKFVNRD